jgi:primosomal protein N'
MFIIECLPLSKSLNKESLSYFGSEYLEPGSLLKINIRGKNTSALVLESRDVVDLKTEIKSANFRLKKISAISSKPFLKKEFLKAVQDTANYFVSTCGGILYHLLPTFVLENTNLLQIPKFTSESLTPSENNISILQAPDEERLALYRAFIREEFAKKKSVFLCLSQNENIRQTKEKLERGIESFVCCFHNEMSKNDFRKEIKKVYSKEHPILIIGTAKWLFLHREDLGAILLDGENESGWKTLSRPFIDLRFFAEILAKNRHVRLIIGDSFLRTETLYRYKQGELSEFESVKWRLPKTAETVVIDLKRKGVKEKFRPNTTNAEEFKTLSSELLDLIKENVRKNSNIFIFAARKGISSVTVCRDCGEQVKCGNCLAPVILYKTNKGNVFRCHQCGETREAAEVCQNCGSWKLAAFGAGIDRVAEEIKKEIPDIKLFEIHKDVTPTPTKAMEIVRNFYNQRGSVLLGTEMALPYLFKKTTSTAIASFDSLFSLPDFRIREKIFRLILQIEGLAKEKFLIQTRNPNDSVVEFAISSNLAEFYRKEMEDRKILGYPPFGIFIKITARGTRNFVVRETENIKNIFSQHHKSSTQTGKSRGHALIVFNSIHEKKGQQAAVNAVIKLPREKWVDSDFFQILKSLPPHFEIKIDPDNLL